MNICSHFRASKNHQLTEAVSSTSLLDSAYSVTWTWLVTFKSLKSSRLDVQSFHLGTRIMPFRTLLVLKNPWHDQQLFRPSIDRIQCSGTHYILLGERFWLDCTEPWFLNMWYHSLGSQPHSNQGSWLSGRTEVATLDLIVSSAWLLPDSKGWRKDKDNLFASERMLPEV